MTSPDYLDEPPNSSELTDYDRRHLKLYMRLLDAQAAGADWEEAVRVLFELDAEAEPQRAKHVHETHLKRAQWMTEIGYNYLLTGSRH